jgi:AraC-like DNA-binding protein
MKLEIDPVAETAFRAEMVLRALPGLGLAEGICSGMHFRRTTPFIDNDDLVLNIVIAGTAEIRQRGRDVVLGSGEAVLTTGEETGETLLRTGARMKLLRVPRAALAPLTRDLEGAVMRHLPASEQALQLLIGYADVIGAVPGDIAPETARLASGHIRDLMALVLGTTNDGREKVRHRGVRAGRLAAIKAEILKNFDQPNLSIGVLARRHGLSVRYIQMLFADTESTFSEILMQVRLERAFRMLSDPRCHAKPIGTIALEVGFNDLSYFHRAFRRRYGASPGEIRAASRNDGT